MVGKTFFNDHLIHVSKIENIDFELVRKTVLKSSFIVLRGLVPPKNVKISKLAQGLPVGGEIENSDDGTLISAFKNRRDL